MALGPCMRSRSLVVSIACRSAPLRLTPMTCPVVRNKYVTARTIPGSADSGHTREKRRTACRDGEVLARDTRDHSLEAEAQTRLAATSHGKEGAVGHAR